jgi:hypothetical protein
MDKPVFIIEVPKLSDQQCVAVQDFLWDLIRAFESQYFHQLKRSCHEDIKIDFHSD